MSRWQLMTCSFSLEELLFIRPCAGTAPIGTRSGDASLNRHSLPYGRKIAYFPFLKIRWRVYFPLTNTIYMKVEFYLLFSFLPA
jgi:hypothetical protein